jgi:fibronectin-binding autotransporter adhesin
MKLRASMAPALLIVATCLSTARAQSTLYWDIDGGTAGAGGATPAGMWDTTTPNWNLDQQGDADLGGATTWTPGDDAIFSAGTDASGPFTVTLDGTQLANSVTFQEGTVTLSGGQLDLTGAGTVTTITGTTQTINSVVGGSVALIKAGADRLILGGANVYSGGTSISAGTLQFANTSAMPISGEVIVASGTTLAVNAGGVGEWTNGTSGGGSIGGLIAGVGGQGTVDQVTWTDGTNFGIDTTNSGGTLAYSGVIGSFRTTAGTTNAVGLTKRGAGTLELSGANTYTGNTTMATNSGTLKLAAANTLNANTVIVMPASNGGAVVELFDSSGNPRNQTIAGISGGGQGTTAPTIVDVGFATLTLNVPSGESYRYDGFLKTNFDQTNANNVGKVVMNGPGEFIIGGANNHATFGFGGQFIANGGRTVFVNNVGLGAATGTARLIINDGATFVKGNAANTSMTISPRTVDINGSFTADMTGSEADFQFLPAAPGSGLGGFNLNGNATITVTGPVDPSFPANTPLGFTPAFILGTRPITDGANSFSITKDGPGLLRLNQTNDFNGGVTILDGTVSVAAALGALGDGPLSLSGGTLNYTGAPVGGVRSHTIDNSITVTADSGIALRGGTGGSKFTPGVEFKFTTSSFTGTGGSLTLRNESNSNEPDINDPYSNPVLFTVTFNGEFNFGRPVAIMNHINPLVSNLRTTVLNSANTSGTQTWSGAISGNGGLKRTGSGGVTVLSGTNTYTGGTTVEAGTLQASGTSTTAFGSGNVTVTGGVLDIVTGAANAIANTATLDISGTGMVALAAGINEFVTGLILDGIGQGDGTYGSSSSPATFQFDQWFSGDGIITVEPAPTGLPGDYNEDNVVDAADYVVWRKMFGSPVALPNDDTAGVGIDDYDRWTANFGATQGGGGGIANTSGAVPEPGTLVLAMLTLLVAGAYRRRPV